MITYQRGWFSTTDLGNGEVGVYDASEHRVRLTFAGPAAERLAHHAVDELHDMEDEPLGLAVVLANWLPVARASMKYRGDLLVFTEEGTLVE